MLLYVIKKIHRLLYQLYPSNYKVNKDSHITDKVLMIPPTKRCRPVEVLAEGKGNLERVVEKKDDEY